MKQQISNLIKSDSIKQLIKYGLVGVVGLVIDMGIYYLLVTKYSVHYPFSDKFSLSKRRYHSENPLLVTPFKICLKPDNVKKCSFFVILPKLNNGVMSLAVVCRLKTNRPQRTKKKRLFTAFGNYFHRKTALKVAHFFFVKLMLHRCFRIY